MKRGSIWATILVALAWLTSGGVAVAQALDGLTLTGRVVDAANLLPSDARARIEAKLKAHEDRTSDQIVVATVPSLGGGTVEDAANILFRRWKLGQAKTDNGVLFLVAPNERKVRIEVGYGLEGSLTDAISSVIIRSAVAPRFKAGDYAGGIEAGVDAVIGTLTGDTDEWQRRARLRDDGSVTIDPVVAFLVFLFLAILLNQIIRGRRGGPGGRAHRTRGGDWIVLPSPSSGSSWGGGWSGGGGDGGFSGGGGSSGGGGASGSW